VSEQSWDLGTIKAGESIKLQYSVLYKKDTPSGYYTNTATVEAYKKPNDPKTKISIADAIHTLQVSGVGLSIGNVGVFTFIPNGNGQSSALITWETSKGADGQVFLSPQGVASPFDTRLHQYGYQRASYRTPALSTLHYIIVPGLQNGATYTYRLRSVNGTHSAFGGDYTFTVPGVPVTAIAPAPVYKPMPVVSGTSVITAKPKASQALPTPVTKPPVLPVTGGFVNQVKNKVFNFFH
jgi:hypothetical protein